MEPLSSLISCFTGLKVTSRSAPKITGWVGLPLEIVMQIISYDTKNSFFMRWRSLSRHTRSILDLRYLEFTTTFSHACSGCPKALLHLSKIIATLRKKKQTNIASHLFAQFCKRAMLCQQVAFMNLCEQNILAFANESHAMLKVVSICLKKNEGPTLLLARQTAIEYLELMTKSLPTSRLEYLIQSLPNLTHLKIDTKVPLEEVAVDLLSRQRQLVSLSFYTDLLSAARFRELCLLPKLKSLAIHARWIFVQSDTIKQARGSHLSNVYIQLLHSIPGRRMLAFTIAKTDALFEAIGALRKLVTVELELPYISDSSLDRLGMPAARYDKLSICCKRSDLSIRSVIRLTELATMLRYQTKST